MGRPPPGHGRNSQSPPRLRPQLRFVFLRRAGFGAPSVGAVAMIDRTHDPDLTSWVESANLAGTEFPIQNLPFVTFRRPREGHPRAGAAIGDQLLDLEAAFRVESIASVMSMAKPLRTELRGKICQFLTRYS